MQGNCSDVCLVSNNIQHGCKALIQGEDSVYTLLIIALFFFPLVFN